MKDLIKSIRIPVNVNQEQFADCIQSTGLSGERGGEFKSCHPDRKKDIFPMQKMSFFQLNSPCGELNVLAR